MSPVLFNLAFEPLLRQILHDESIRGYVMPSPTADSDLIARVLAYADDAIVLLQDPADFHRLRQHLSTYSAASNAR
ncbi:hypothetical protein DFQ30_002496, partial [Apophysomyces sp. BC1015]